MSTVLTDETVQQHLQANLRLAMDRMGLSIRKLAERAGDTPHATVQGILGGNIPRAGVFSRVARALGFTMDELLLDPATFEAILNSRL